MIKVLNVKTDLKDFLYIPNISMPQLCGRGAH